jgi:hypothetical protein
LYTPLPLSLQLTKHWLHLHISCGLISSRLHMQGRVMLFG